MISNVEEITNSIINNLQEGHAFGFCSIPSEIDPCGVSFIFHGGCSWDDFSNDSLNFHNLQIFEPSLGTFRTLPQKNTEDRYRHSIVFRYKKVSGIRQVYLFGGITDRDFTSDFRMYDMNPQKLSQSQNSEEEGVGEFDEEKEFLTGDRYSWKILNFKGQDDLSDLGFHTGVYHEHSDCMYIFGGKNNDGRRNKLLICDFEKQSWDIHDDSTCSKLSSKSWPSRRAGHTMNFINEHRFLIFGGMDTEDNDLNEICVYDCLSGLWEQWMPNIDVLFCEERKKSKLKNIPGQRASHSSVVLGNYLYIHGGATLDIQFHNQNFSYSKKYIVHNDLFRFSLVTRRWERIELLGNQLPNPAYMRILCPYIIRENGERKGENNSEIRQINIENQITRSREKVKIVVVGGLASDTNGYLKSTDRVFEMELFYDLDWKERQKEINGIQKKKLYRFMKDFEAIQIHKKLRECELFKDIRIITS